MENKRIKEEKLAQLTEKLVKKEAPKLTKTPSCYVRKWKHPFKLGGSGLGFVKTETYDDLPQIVGYTIDHERTC